MKKNQRLGMTLVAASLFWGANAAQAVKIDFGSSDAGFPYTEDGFKFSIDQGAQWRIQGSVGNPAASLNSGLDVAPALNDQISVTHESGLPFLFHSFDFASSSSGLEADDVELRGILDGFVQGAVSAESSSTVWETRDLNQLNWGLIDTLRIEVTTANNAGLLLDNFELTAVPVPAAIWLLGSGIVALGTVARRRRQTG